MSLLNRNNNNNNNNDGNEANENNENSSNEHLMNGGMYHNGGDSNDMDHRDDKTGSLLFDFSNNNDMLLNGGNGSIRKKRKHNPDKDKYIQEPQYVTKRTSSGRLVKMKIINDFDYTSDQEQEAKKRKSKIKKKNFKGALRKLGYQLMS